MGPFQKNAIISTLEFQCSMKSNKKDRLSKLNIDEEFNLKITETLQNVVGTLIFFSDFFNDIF